MKTSVRWVALIIRVTIAGACAVLFWRYGDCISDTMRHTGASTIAGVTGTLLGFLITAMALITAVMDRALISNMRKNGLYQRLVCETFFTCAALLATTISGIICLFLISPILIVASAIMVGLAVFSILYVLEAGYRFLNVITTL